MEILHAAFCSGLAGNAVDDCLASDAQVWCSNNSRRHFTLCNIVESINAALVY